MIVVAIPALTMSCFSLFTGVFYLWIYLRRKNEKEKLYFALTCFNLGLYDFFCAGLYNAASIYQGIVWQRLQFASLAFLIVFFIRFIYHFTGGGPEKTVNVFTLLSLAFFIAGIAIHSDLTLTIANPSVKHIVLGRFVDITYHECEPGIIYTGQLVLAVAGYIWIIARLIWPKSRKKRGTTAIIVAFIFFFVGILNDTFVGLGVYSFIYIAEYLYLGIILTMAYVLLNRFVDIQFELEDLNETLEHKVENKTEELRAAMEELESMNDALVSTNTELEQAQKAASLDMAMAANVQKKLYTREIPRLDDWDIAYYFRPAAGVSGDLYDFYTRDNMLAGIALFDVSGHGISAGLFTLLARSILFRNFRMHKESGPARVMEAINGELITEISDVDNYLSGILLMFEGPSVRYANAAHPDVIMKKGDGSGCGPLLPQGRSLGGCLLGLSQISEPFEVFQFTAEPGDTAVMFTDGLIESINSDGEIYGVERVTSSLSLSTAHDPGSVVRSLVADLFNFTGTEDLADDLTIIVAMKK